MHRETVDITLRDGRPARLTLPEGYTERSVREERSRYLIGRSLWPLASAGGAVSWGVPLPSDSCVRVVATS